MLRVASDRFPELALCAVDVLPVLQKDIAEVVVRVSILRVALDRCPELALCAVDVLPVLQEEKAEAYPYQRTSPHKLEY